MRGNWYILFALATKQEQLCNVIRNQGVNAFIPVMEYYRRDIKDIAVKPMFPGYVFVRTDMDQEEFDFMLNGLGDQKQGLIKQLREEGTTAMREEEIDFFECLLDEHGVSKMSYAYLQGNRAIVTDGSLKHFQDRIVKVDRHNRLAWLDFEFMSRKIQAGLTICSKKELVPDADEDEATLADGTILDIEELKSKMMGL